MLDWKISLVLRAEGDILYVLGMPCDVTAPDMLFLLVNGGCWLSRFNILCSECKSSPIWICLWGWLSVWSL